MIVKEQIEQVVNEWLEGKEYFLVDLQIGSDNKITVEIDQNRLKELNDMLRASQKVIEVEYQEEK